MKYDSRARAYDALIGSRIYNRRIWGSSPDEYRAFARRAVESGRGPLLDAGCGTLLFTADAYAASRRPIVAVDLSPGMLRRGQQRLSGAHRVSLVQGDLRHLPVRPAAFGTVLSMGMLHLFDPLEPVLESLLQSLAPRGKIFLTSLVANGRLGDPYMRLLHAAGEIARPRTAQQLEGALRHHLGADMTYSVTGNMAYACL